MKILLAVDGSNYTRRMLAYLAAHDELLGQGHALTALAVLQPLPSHVSQFISKETIDDFHAEQANHILRPVSAFAKQQGWNLEARHMVGQPAEAIAQTADHQDCDLIVMGSHGHTALGALVMGSVTTGVMARTRRPVLVIR